MATLNQIIYNIRNSKKGGILSDDDKVTDRQLAFIIGYYRSMLIKQNLEKGRKPPYAAKQTLSVVEMVQTDKSDDCDTPVDCYTLRSKARIPLPIDYAKGVLLTFVGTIDGEESFQFQSQARSRWSKYERFTSNLRKAYIRDGYLFVVNDLIIEVVQLQGIFQQPELAAGYKLNCDSDEPCFTFDSEYPIESSMIPLVTKLIFENEMALLSMTPQDTTNDTSDRVQEQPNPGISG
jgi:hypothetical protein